MKPDFCILVPKKLNLTYESYFKVACKLGFELPDRIKNSPEAKAKISKSLQETGNFPWEESDLRDLYATIEDIKSKGPHGRAPYSLEVVTKVQEDKCYFVMTVRFIDHKEAQKFIEKNHLTVTHHAHSKSESIINPETGKPEKIQRTQVVPVI